MRAEQLIPRETIAERLVILIREDILRFRPGFEPGQRIDIQQLATKFEVSATPVKEALKRLEAHGLVEVRARRGVFVTTLSLRDVEEIVAIRTGIEQLAFRLCGGHVAPESLEALERSLAACDDYVSAGELERYRDEDMVFHRLIVETGGNRRLVALYQRLLDELQVIEVYTPRTMENIEASLREHRHLLSIICQGGLHAIEAEVEAHWKQSKTRLLDSYAAYLRGREGSDERPRQILRASTLSSH